MIDNLRRSLELCDELQAQLAGIHPDYSGVMVSRIKILRASIRRELRRREKRMAGELLAPGFAPLRESKEQ